MSKRERTFWTIGFWTAIVLGTAAVIANLLALLGIVLGIVR